MGFFSKLFAFFKKKKSTEQLLQEQSLAIIAKINDLEKNGGISDPHDRIALKNVSMMMKNVTDKFNAFTSEDVSEISGVINSLISDIKKAAFGISSVSSFENKPLASSVKNYIALLAYYINGNIRSGEKMISESDMDERRAAASNVYNNEALGVQLSEKEKERAELEKVIADLEKADDDIIDAIASMNASDSAVSALTTRHQGNVEEKKEKLSILNMVNASIKKIKKQMLQNEHYAKLLEETRVLGEVLGYSTFGTIEELDRAIEKYNTEFNTVDTVQNIADERLKSINNNTSVELERDEKLEAALKKARENEQNAKTKAEDSANFDINKDNSNNN